MADKTAEDDLDLKPAGAGMMFQAEMFFTNTFLGYWKYLVVAGLVIGRRNRPGADGLGDHAFLRLNRDFEGIASDFRADQAATSSASDRCHGTS